MAAFGIKNERMVVRVFDVLDEFRAKHLTFEQFVMCIHLFIKGSRCFPVPFVSDTLCLSTALSQTLSASLRLFDSASLFVSASLFFVSASLPL